MGKFIDKVLAGVLIVITIILLIISTGVNTKLSFRWVVSGSMEPTISTGALVLLRAYDEAEIPRVNDIIVFRNENLFGDKDIVHRVIGIEGTGVLTKGDHNKSADGITPIEKVKYKVVKICNGTVGYYQLINKIDQRTLNIAFIVAEAMTVTFTVVYILIIRKEEKENRKLLS